MESKSLSAVIGLVTGILFGFGLALSQMLHPQKVIAFLNVLGDWDGSLLLVMVGAMAVFGSGYWLIVCKRNKPLFCNKFHLPERKDIDSSLVVGSCLFGLGWGLAGICPGPAIGNLINGDIKVYAFVAMLVVGLLLSGRIRFERK